MSQQTEAPLVGKLTEAELDQARMDNVIPLHRGFVVRRASRICPPCNGNCEQGDACPHCTQPEPAEAATSVGHTELRSAWSPAVNVFLIVVAFCVASVLAILKANKPAIVVALCVLLPLVLVACVSAWARWKA